MFFFYIICCLIATMIGAICGVGGGIIIRSILDAVSGLPISEIGFLSGCTVLSMSAASLLTSETWLPIRSTRYGLPSEQQ